MISIVIPVLNEEEFLPGCLKSLTEQDYDGGYEIIVVDNCSGDDSPNIARRFGAILIEAHEKKNVSYARQAGAEAAAGDIIIQADADTVYPEDWLKKMAKRFEDNPRAVAVAGRYIYIDPPWWARIEYSGRNLLNIICTILFGRPLLISGATFAFRKNAFLAIDGYNGLSYSADQFGISGRLKKTGRIIYAREIYVSTSSRRVKKRFIIILVEVMINLGHWLGYYVKRGWAAMMKFFKKRPGKRFALRLLPLLIIVVAIPVWGYVIPTSQVFGKVYWHGNDAQKVVALTFDDGPNEPYTSQVLAILASHNITATFFCIGENVALYPQTAREIVAEGSVIGNHTWDHDPNHALTGYGAKDIKMGENEIYKVTGVLPHLYRPPHGKKSPWEMDALRDDGMIEIVWSTFANDEPILGRFGKISPSELASELIQRTSPGSIILMHDGYGLQHNDRNANKSLTVKALPTIINTLQSEGYKFVTVPQLLHVRAYNTPSSMKGES